MNNIIKCDNGSTTDVPQPHRFSTIPHSKNTLPGNIANIIMNNSRWWDLKWKSLERTSSSSGSSSSQVTDRTLFISSGRTRTTEMYRCTCCCCCCSDCSRPRVVLPLWLSLQMTVWQAALPWEQVIKQSHRIYFCFVRRDLEIYDCPALRGRGWIGQFEKFLSEIETTRRCSVKVTLYRCILPLWPTSPLCSFSFHQFTVCHLNKTGTDAAVCVLKRAQTQFYLLFNALFRDVDD